MAGVACALPAAILLWQFMVDDALISARYASNLARGLGYRFNPGGEVTDGVTALGWAPLLAPFARGGPLGAFYAAKIIGLASWLVGAAALAVGVDRLEGGRGKWAALALVLCSAPLGAWSVAGMETGLVLGLAAVAVASRALGREALALALAGVVAALRPEAVLWAGALALAPAREGQLSRWRALALASTPAALVAALRWAVFGRLLPLSIYAKTPELGHGVRYAVACFLLTGPIAVLAWRRLPGWIRGLQVSVLAHYLAMVVAGGDWMPLSRLAVTVLPTVVLVAAHLLGADRLVWSLPRLGMALAGQLFAFAQAGPAAATVGSKRMAVVTQLSPLLATSRSVAALDIGWVGAATEADVVDLAGVTDPAVAALTGGHTSKRIPPSLLDARRVDTLVLLLRSGTDLAEPWYDSQFARFVEHWVVSTSAADVHFDLVGRSEPPLQYVVLRRRAAPVEPLPSDG